MTDEQENTIILDSDFYVKLNDIFYKSVLDRIIELKNSYSVENTLSLINPSAIKKEYSDSVGNCFVYFNEKAKYPLSETQKNYFNEKRISFLSENSKSLLSAIDDFCGEGKTMIENISNTSLGLFIEAVKARYSKTIEKGLYSGIGGIFAKIKNSETLGGEDKTQKKEIKTLINFYNKLDDLFLIYDNMFETLCDLVDESKECLPLTYIPLI